MKKQYRPLVALCLYLVRTIVHIARGIPVLTRSIDEDNLIPAFGFGDRSTEDKGVFSFTEDFQANFGVDAVLNRYREHVVPNVIMAGPTSFGPIIREAIHLVNETASYHILIIIADGQVTRSVDTPPGQSSREERDTIDAIVQASYFPLSIVVVGVGDGPWDTMKHFDDCSLDRKFDNFQFVHFNVSWFPI